MSRHDTGAMPEASDAIRLDDVGDESPALAFDARARPGALVSWAWVQLTALDTLLRAVTERAGAGGDEVDLADAVRTVLVPTIKALAFSERRAHELARAPGPSRRRRRGRRRRPRDAVD